MGEILFVVALLGGFLGVSAVFKQWWLFKVFVVFFICFGLVEWWAVSSTDMSVSQHFWEFSTNNRTGGIIVLGGMAVAWGALLWHLGYKMFKKK